MFMFCSNALNQPGAVNKSLKRELLGRMRDAGLWTLVSMT